MTRNCNWLIRIVERKRRELIAAVRADYHTIESKTRATVAIEQMTGREVEEAYSRTH